MVDVVLSRTEQGKAMNDHPNHAGDVSAETSSERFTPGSIGQVMHREPLVHFMLLAALLFLLDHVFSSAQQEKII